MKTITTVHPANKSELNKILKGMTVNELLADLSLVTNYITPLNKRVEHLDKIYNLDNCSQVEHEANTIDAKLFELDYYLGRLKTTLKRCMDKIPEDSFVKLVDDLVDQSKERTSKGNKTKTAKIALKHLSIISDNYIALEYNEAA